MMETYRGVVYPRQLDHMGHMNVQWYTSKFDQATWHLFSAMGITNEYITKNRRGMAALEQLTNYKAEAVAGDLLYIKTSLLAVDSKVVHFLHVMYDASTDREVASSKLTSIHLDLEKRKGCAFPEEIRSKCEALL